MVKGPLDILELIIHVLEIIYEYINSIVIAFAKSGGNIGNFNLLHFFGSILRGVGNMPLHQIVFTSFVAVSSFAVVSHSADVTSVQHDLNESVINSSFNNTTNNISGHVICSYCNGTGFVIGDSFNQWVVCDECGGSGYLSDDDSNNTVICSVCRGNGGQLEVIDGERFGCPVCGGAGFVSGDGSNETVT